MTDWRPQPAADLPDGLVLFDGVCVMCSAWVGFIIPRDPQRRYRFVPVQSDLGRALSDRFGIDPAAPETNMVVRDGQAWFKADCAIAIGGDLPGWRWIGALRLVPMALRNAAYDLLARNRYRLFGKRDSCPMPPPEIRYRFVTTLDGLA